MRVRVKRQPPITDITLFQMKCIDKIIKKFYNDIPEEIARQRLYIYHSEYLKSKVEKRVKKIYKKFLKSIGVNPSKESFYLLYMLQKVGEDKANIEFSYNHALFSQIKAIFGKFNNILTSKDTYEIAVKLLKDSTPLLKSIIFALNVFIEIWEIVET